MEKINKIILLGQSGQIGSNLKKKIRSIAKNIRCLSKKDLNLEKLSFIKTKLDKFKPNLIINASAFTKVDEAEKDKKKCFKINVSSTKEIAKWAFKNKCFLTGQSFITFWALVRALEIMFKTATKICLYRGFQSELRAYFSLI